MITTADITRREIVAKAVVAEYTDRVERGDVTAPTCCVYHRFLWGEAAREVLGF